MEFKPTKKSSELVYEISKRVPTFHHHYHILYDIACLYENKKVNYVEIGAFAGASACLMLHLDNVNVISIDLGFPVPKEDVLSNLSYYKKKEQFYEYIQGDSQDIATKKQLIKTLSEIDVDKNKKAIDILFIDGNHSYQAVIDDFKMYSDLVDFGGYIVFDDYNDHVHCPEVKQAVHDLIPTLTDYEIVGALENTVGAFPQELKEGNCFVIKKIK